MFTKPTPNTECWGKTMFAAIYSLYKTKNIYKFFKFTILPSSFFNIEWCINSKYPGHGDYIESQWFTKKMENKDHLFLESFAWHWHNSSKKDYEVVDGSKFDLLQKFVSNRLEQRGIEE